jgi:hypothetical protein
VGNPAWGIPNRLTPPLGVSPILTSLAPLAKTKGKNIANATEFLHYAYISYLILYSTERYHHSKLLNNLYSFLKIRHHVLKAHKTPGKIYPISSALHQ